MTKPLYLKRHLIYFSCPSCGDLVDLVCSLVICLLANINFNLFYNLCRLPTYHIQLWKRLEGEKGANMADVALWRTATNGKFKNKLELLSPDTVERIWRHFLAIKLIHCIDNKREVKKGELTWSTTHVKWKWKEARAKVKGVKKKGGPAFSIHKPLICIQCWQPRHPNKISSLNQSQLTDRLDGNHILPCGLACFRGVNTLLYQHTS